jgi:6-pyruvoyl-tetrahydropterin synthase
MSVNKSNQSTNNNRDLITKQLRILDKQEHNFLNPKENQFFKTKIVPITENIEAFIPKKVKTTLNTAFYKGFQLVFEKGNSYIEKTYDKDKILLEHDLNNYAVDKSKTNRYLKRLDKQSSKSKLLNSSFAAVEGGVLGILGIGLVDIPIFIAVIIRNVNEIALSYGFQYDSREEKYYILTLISAAIAKDEKQNDWNVRVDKLGAVMNQHKISEDEVKEQMKKTSELLSDAILTAKFVQGIPIVGAIGGLVNHTVIRKVGRYATLKYKKRYLLQKLRNVN